MARRSGLLLICSEDVGHGDLGAERGSTKGSPEAEVMEGGFLLEYMEVL